MNILNGGQLDIVLGTMFSGKTTYLLSKIAKMAELNYSILYINIEFDNRSENIFSTHNPFFDSHVDFVKKESIKNNVQMIKSKSLSNIDITNKDVIIIDESHFFDDLVDFTNKCLDLNKYVLVSGLIADFKGNKFGKTLDLIPICTNIKRLHAYCSECAKDKKCTVAIYSKKIVKCRKSIDIGGSDKYIPVCRCHYNQVEQPVGIIAGTISTTISATISTTISTTNTNISTSNNTGIENDQTKIKTKINKSKKIEKELDSDKSNEDNNNPIEITQVQ
jgi:thymidine kinase